MATFSLNGQAISPQTLATGISGTDFNIISGLGVHTFNIPNASAIARGLLTANDWSIFNGKQSALGFTPVSNSTTVNDQALTGNITLSTADILDSLNKRYVTDAKLTVLGNTSGINTGDITIGTGNGLSLSGQSLSIALSGASATGTLSSLDWNTFNNKQSALGYTPLNPANNLSDLANAGTARTNLGLGTLATQSGTFSGTSSGTNTGDQTTISGNAGTASALQTARTINGVSFNGTANITATAAAGTLTGTTLASGVTGSSLTSLGTLGSLALSGAITGATGYNGLIITPNTGAITTGTWNGTIITSAFGGTGNGFTKFTGPATSEKTFTLPNTSATILTNNSAVTVAQGGTGNSSLTAYALLAGGTTTTGALQQVSGLGASGQVLTSNGAGVLPTWQTVSGGGSGTGYTIVEKTADESTNTDTTLTNDADLHFSASASTAYVVEFIIRYHSSSATPDFKYTITGPAGAIFRGIGIAYDATSDTGNVNIDACNIESITTLCTIVGTQAPDFLIHITGIMEVQGTAGTVAFQWAQNNSNATNTTVDQDSILRYLTLSGASGADLAELYSTNDTSLAPGDVVSLGPSLRIGVKKSEIAQDKNVIGIISTSPGLVIGGISNEGVRDVLVTLSGRVPVKVVTENGAIQPGDYLTPSSQPGVAMKLSGSGPVIGQAISAYSGEEVGMVMVFVKNFELGSIQQVSVLIGDISPKVNADGSDNGLSALVATIQSETAHDPVAIVTKKIMDGKQFITDFVAARMTAIRGYFDEVFAKKVHTEQVCLKKTDGSEICVSGDQLDALLQNAGPNSPAPAPTPDPTPVPDTTPTPDPTSTPDTTPTPDPALQPEAGQPPAEAPSPTPDPTPTLDPTPAPAEVQP